MTIDFVGLGGQLTTDEIVERAVRLHVQPAALLAVVDVEAAGEGFISKTDLRMKMLFEAHLFSRFTGNRFDSSHPNISSRSWNKALYGKGGSHQYERIEQAIELDEEAALRAASWGMGQVLGMNWEMVGFNSVHDMIENNKQSEDNQFDTMIKFCEKSRALSELRGDQPDFERFTRIYNGPGQVAYYSARLRAAYFKWQQGLVDKTPAPRVQPEAWDIVLVEGMVDDKRVEKVQEELRDRGFYTVPPFEIDGDFGPGTKWAVMQFQSASGLVRDGIVGPNTLNALGLSSGAS